MIEILNKLINIVVGTSDLPYLLHFYDLKQSYRKFVSNFLEEISPFYYDMELNPIDIVNHLKGFDFKLFLQWIFSSPDVIMSFIFYCMVTYGIIFFFIIVPFRLIKQLLPRSVRTKKGTNKA